MGNSSSMDKPGTVPAPADQASTSQASACPVPPELRSRGPVYNVYNQVIDARNMMPAEPNQQPFPGQQKLLSVERIQSSIPKGGTNQTWLYPSPQMFFNSLKRKGKGDDVTEDDMAVVVHAHNTMNELTWNKVIQWEHLHRHECDCPKLRRFLGRPDSLSPLARLSSWFGGPLPFDRHDWYVDRCGHEVRYVIDFYFDDAKAGSPEAFSIRARPAIDSLDAVLDRVKMRIYTVFAKYGLPCPVTGQPGSLGKDDEESSAQQPA